MSTPTKKLQHAAVYVWVGVFDGDHWPYHELRRATVDGLGVTADNVVPEVIALLERAGFTKVKNV